MHRNPFEYGRELGPAELVDRSDELAAVAGTLERQGKLFLIGPRRYGKTSILRVAAAIEEDRGGCVLRYDAQAFPSIADLAERLAADAVRRLTPSVDRAAKAVTEFFGAVRPTASFDPALGSWSLALAGAPHRAAGGPLLADVLDGVERAATRARKRVAVIIDEFQEVIEHGGSATEAQIRAAIQRHTHVAYVFAGSKTRLLSDMVSDASRPFYRLGAVLFLGAIPRPDFAAFLRDSFERSGLTVTDDGIAAILDVADDVPYNVQALASACWDRAATSGTGASFTERTRAATPIDAAFVLAVGDAEARRLDPLYTQIWGALTAPQRQAVLAVIRESGRGLLAAETSRRYKLSVATMQSALDALEKKLIIRSDATGMAPRWRLEDPLFRAWVVIALG